MLGTDKTEQLTSAPAMRASVPSRESDQHLWTELKNAADKTTFCHVWLRLQCLSFSSGDAGLLLLQEDHSLVQASVWPEAPSEQKDLQRVAERALIEGRDVVFWAKGEAGGAGTHAPGILIGFPILANDVALGVVTIRLSPQPAISLPAVLHQLHWGTGRLAAFLLCEQVQTEAETVRRTAEAFDILAVAGEHALLKAAVLAIANELATRFSCDRVSIGTIRRTRIRVLGISNSAWFQRKAQLIEAIESAMEEAADQNTRVAHPTLDAADRRIIVAHRALAKSAGASAVATLLIPGREQLFGAITLERHSGTPFDPGTIKACELTAVLIGPLLEAKAQASRLVAGSIVDKSMAGLHALRGPRRPALKLATVSVLALLAYLALAEGDHRISAKSVIEGAVQRAAVAPFDGFVAQAPVRAGDTVRERQILAVLDEKDLVLDRLKWAGELEKYLKRQREALAKHDRASLGVLEAQIKQAESELALAEEKLARTRIIAPFDGLVVSGDLSQMLGSPVEQGQVLFEIAPLQSYRIILQVDERDLRYAKVGQTGRLALTGAPDHRLPFSISKITPVSTADNGKNVFRVEATLQETHPRLRPGMEGVAKIKVGQRSLAWIWVHPLIDWVRLAVWKWLP